MRMHTPTERTPRTRRVWRIGYPMIATLSTAFLLIVAGAVPASSAPQLDLPRVASTDVDTGLVRSVDG